MVLESLLNKIGKRKFYSFFLGLLYVLISYGTALIFFPENISVTMLFFITLLLVPSAMRLISIEEKKERKDGLKNFLNDHTVVIEVLSFLFIGIFVGFLALGHTTDSASIFSYQSGFLENQGMSKETIENFLKADQNKLNKFTGIAVNNLGVCLVTFVLSFFYGVGAMFLIVLNASTFSFFVISVTQYLGKTAQEMLSLMGIFSTYMIPEVAGFLLASIAGGVISKAVTTEKLGSDKFKNVVKDATLLLVISCLIILIAALLEVYLASSLINVIF